MPSSYSNNLKIELIATGEQSGTWGNTTNTNLGTTLEEAIVGRAVVTFPSDADYTLTYATSNASQAARAVYLVVQSAVNLSSTRNLVVPTIFKNYIVSNNTSNGQTIVVKTSAGTGISVPNGRTAFLYVDGTNVINAFDYFSTLTIDSLALTGTPTAPTAAPGTNTTQIATTAFVIAERSTSATLTNKTISADNNTISGIAASSFVLSNASGNIDGAAAQKVIPAGVVVGTTDTQTLTNKTITNLIFDGNYTEDVFTITDGGSVDLNPANGTVQLWTLGANRSPTASSFASGQSMTLMVLDGSAFTITWPSVTWVNGVAPTLDTTKYTVIELWKVSTTLYGALVGAA